MMLQQSWFTVPSPGSFELFVHTYLPYILETTPYQGTIQAQRRRRGSSLIVRWEKYRYAVPVHGTREKCESVFPRTTNHPPTASSNRILQTNRTLRYVCCFEAGSHFLSYFNLALKNYLSALSHPLRFLVSGYSPRLGCLPKRMHPPSMSRVTSLLVLIYVCSYYESLPTHVAAAATATTNIPPPLSPPLECDFPAIYHMTLPKSELIHNLLVRKWIAELDLLTMKCNHEDVDEAGEESPRSQEAAPLVSCRLTTLVHSENEYHSMWERGWESHHQNVLDTLQCDQVATSGLWHNRQKSLQDTVPPEPNRWLSPYHVRRVVDGDDDDDDDPTIDDSTVTVSRMTGDYTRISGFSCMLNYQGTMEWIQDLVNEQQVPHDGNASNSLRSDVMLTWTDIGDSYLKTTNSTLGHDIRVLKVSGINGGKNSSFEKAPFLMLTGVHPREYAPPELVRRWIHWLVTTQTDVRARLLLETTDVYWVPYVNPDGRVLAETSQIYRRKNVNSEASGQESCSDTSYGVDLNRNFPFRYGRDDGSNSFPCSDVFRGSGPASEPEVQAVIGLGETIFPKSQRVETVDQSFLDEGIPQAYNETTTRGVFLDIHSFGNTYIYVSPS